MWIFRTTFLACLTYIVGLYSKLFLAKILKHWRCCNYC
ncbi:hypothetical protein F383_25678 [Gossypium arboreum]|uniref:Uncharacterized protein n=1 Tax=Gossypium arboreum TaxID=29729 RepID=A0A0B0MUY5_GOSAR|nr:hypothetical protein F383_25678 [Gossypium arboreum]